MNTGSIRHAWRCLSNLLELLVDIILLPFMAIEDLLRLHESMNGNRPIFETFRLGLIETKSHLW